MINAFWKRLGNPNFWADPTEQEMALETLSQQYLNTEHGEYANRDAAYLKSALLEYERRKGYMELRCERE